MFAVIFTLCEDNHKQCQWNTLPLTMITEIMHLNYYLIMVVAMASAASIVFGDLETLIVMSNAIFRSTTCFGGQYVLIICI